MRSEEENRYTFFSKCLKFECRSDIHGLIPRQDSYIRVAGSFKDESDRELNNGTLSQ